MATTYLKKRRLHQRAAMLLQIVSPDLTLQMCGACLYSFLGGSEWLKFPGGSVHSLSGGRWMMVRLDTDDGKVEHIFSKWDGEQYHYHSVHNYVKQEV